MADAKKSSAQMLHRTPIRGILALRTADIVVATSTSNRRVAAMNGELAMQQALTGRWCPRAHGQDLVEESCRGRVHRQGVGDDGADVEVDVVGHRARRAGVAGHLDDR